MCWEYSVTFVALVVARCCLALPPVIKIGAVFNEDQKGSNVELAFQYAVYRINKDPTLLPNTTLVYEAQYVPKEDSFHAGKKACSMIRSGVTAVFGPSDPVLAGHVQSICDALDIPHIEARLDLETDLKEFSINLFPSNRLLNKAYGDLIRFLNWTKVAIIYRDEFGFLKLQELVRKPPHRNMEVMIRQGDPTNYRRILLDVKRSDFFNLIVDTKPEDMSAFLTSILQLQMNDYFYHYLFTTFNLETFDLEHFKYNYVNITSLRIVDTDQVPVRQVLRDMQRFQPLGLHILNSSSSIIQAEPALIYDSVHVLARGLQSLEQSATLRLANITCEDELPWNDGSSLFNYINSVEFSGLTGKIQFKEGRRTNVKLDILKLRHEALQKVGEWTPSLGVNITNWPAYYQEGQPNVTLMVTTIEQIPYVMLKKGENVTGNDRFEGFCIDLLREISKAAGFNYVLELVPDRIYGVQNPETHEWNGMMKELLEKRADLAVASLTINYAREKVVDFTKPFLNLGIGILFKVETGQSAGFFTFLNPLAVEIWLYVGAAFVAISFTLFVMARFSPYEWSSSAHPCLKECDSIQNQFSLSNSFWFITGTLLRQGSGLNPKVASVFLEGKVPSATPGRLFTFMNPLAVEIWLYVLGAYVMVSFTMFAVARFSPYEWYNPHPCLGESDVIENQFSLANSFWFTIGTLMQQGSDLNPKATSTRIVGGIWWFFTLIIISSYTANLAAFLTVERMTTPIEDVDDLASQSEISYGTLIDGSTMTFFRDSKIEVYQKMWRFMEAQKSTAFLSSYEEGIEKVLAGKYAFLMESTMLDYFIQRDCNLTQISGNLDSKGYGIATQMGSPWRDKISLAILELQEKGVVHQLYSQWWKNTGKNCRRDERNKESKASALDLNNIGGVFVVLLCGLAIAILVSILEFCWNSRKNAQTDRQSLCSEMAEELRFAVRCRGSRQRPALKRQCSRCIPGTTYVPATMEIPQENGIMQMIEMRKSSVHFDCPET